MGRTPVDYGRQTPVEVRNRASTLNMVCDGSESIGGGLVKRVHVNGSAIPNGSEVFAGMDPAPFDFVLSPALTKTGSGRMVRVIRTPEGKAQPHSFKRDEDRRQSDLQVPAADADAEAASMWDDARLVHPLRHARGHGEPRQLARRRRGALRDGAAMGPRRRHLRPGAADAHLSRVPRRRAPPAPPSRPAHVRPAAAAHDFESAAIIRGEFIGHPSRTPSGD